MRDGKWKGTEMRDSYEKKNGKREANKKANKQIIKTHVMAVVKGGGRVGKER